MFDLNKTQILHDVLLKISKYTAKNLKIEVIRTIFKEK